METSTIYSWLSIQMEEKKKKEEEHRREVLHNSSISWIKATFKVSLFQNYIAYTLKASQFGIIGLKSLQNDFRTAHQEKEKHLKLFKILDFSR